MNNPDRETPEVENSADKTEPVADVSTDRQKLWTKKRIIWSAIILASLYGIWFFIYPGSLTLYSIDGRVEKFDANDSFYGYPVLGKVQIINVHSQNKIMSALKQGIDESDGTIAKCFIPRHGIKVTRFGITTEYVICFECLQLDIHSGGLQERVAITRSSQAVLNMYLKEAKIPLAPRMNE